MSLVGSDYLLRIASLSLSFVGFTSILVALRRAVGGELNELHRDVTRFFIVTGIAITAWCVFPEALNFTGMPVSTTWRVASATAGLASAALAFSLLKRARSFKSGSIPGLYINNAIAIIPLVTFLLNAIGFPFGPGVDPYAFALTMMLFLIWSAFLLNLDAFIQPSSRD